MEQYKKIIMENSWHQFIYGYDTEQRHQLLKGLEQDYPIQIDTDMPMAIYLEEYGLPKIDLNLNEMERIQVSGVAREYLNFLIVRRILTRIKECFGMEELDKRMAELLSYTNRCLINKSAKSLQNVTDLLIVLEQSINMYLKGYLNYGEHSFKINEVTIPFIQIESFIRRVKEGLNNHSYFGIIIDKTHDISSFSTRAINGLVGSRINANLSMKVALEPWGWDSYSYSQGQVIQAPHDYSSVELDGSLKFHTEALENKKLIKILKKY